jgi:hypothetical protein
MRSSGVRSSKKLDDVTDSLNLILDHAYDNQGKERSVDLNRWRLETETSRFRLYLTGRSPKPIEVACGPLRFLLPRRPSIRDEDSSIAGTARTYIFPCRRRIPCPPASSA